MKIQNLTGEQLKKLYCAAMGWHSENIIVMGLHSQKNKTQSFDEFYDEIYFERDDDRWIITGKMAQIEITDDLYFRCGMKYHHQGIGGTSFDLLAVFECLKSFGLLGKDKL